MPLSSCAVNMASPFRGRLVQILIYTGMRVLVISFGDKVGGGDIIKLSLACTYVIQAKHRPYKALIGIYGLIKFSNQTIP